MSETVKYSIYISVCIKDVIISVYVWNWMESLLPYTFFSSVILQLITLKNLKFFSWILQRTDKMIFFSHFSVVLLFATCHFVLVQNGSLFNILYKLRSWPVPRVLGFSHCNEMRDIKNSSSLCAMNSSIEILQLCSYWHVVIYFAYLLLSPLGACTKQNVGLPIRMSWVWVPAWSVVFLIPQFNQIICYLHVFAQNLFMVPKNLGGIGWCIAELLLKWCFNQWQTMKFC